MFDRYAKIREVLKMNPTPGPWDGDGYSVSRLWSNGTMGIREYIALPDTTDDHEPNPADMRFIAACDPDTLRELLDERDALAAENKKLREALERVSDEAGHWAYVHCRVNIGSEHEDELSEFVTQKVRLFVESALTQDRDDE